MVSFSVLSLIPFFPVAISIVKLRSAVIFDGPISWVKGQETKFIIPLLDKGIYELRLQSHDSKWEPSINLSWGIREIQTSRDIMPRGASFETILTRPIAKIHIQEQTLGENELSVIFADSNPTPNKMLRIKLSRDLEAILTESARQFAIALAISLVLMLFLLKPLTRSFRPQPAAPQP